MKTKLLTHCSWLFACAEKGGIVPVEPHLLVQQSPHEADDNLGTGGREEQGERDGDENGEERGSEALVENGRLEEKEREEEEARPYLHHESGVEANTVNVLDGVILCLNRKIPAPGQYSRIKIVSIILICLCVRMRVCCACVTADLHNLAGSLGADCHWSFSESCTHYVYQVNS